MSKPKGFARVIIVLTVISAAIMELVDTSIVNVALSEMSGSLGVNIEDVSWVITSYAIANVIIIPLTGFLAEYFGRKNYYIASMIIFTIASYMCGQSSGLVELIVWRLVQGIGGGALLSTSQAILFDTFEPEDRPIAAGLFGMGIVLGPTLGPTLGGYLIENYSWPVIFMINIPIGIVATILSFTFIDKKEGEGKNKKNIEIDYLGILLLTAGIGCLQFVLERGESEDWFSSNYIRVTSVIAIIGLIGFIWRELVIPNPAVKLSIMKNRSYAFTTIFTFVLGLGLFTSVFVYPVLAQRVLGFTAYETGLSLLAPTLIGIVMMPIVGKLMTKGVPPKYFVVCGFTLFASYAWLSARVSPEVGRMAFFIPLMIRGIGMSMGNMPLINQAVAGLQPNEYAAGIALNNMIRQIGGAFGIALANNYVAHQYMEHRTTLVANTYQGNPALTERISTLVGGFMSRAGSDIATATKQAYLAIDLAIDRQAYYLSYLDTFHLVAIFFIAVLPLTLFLKSPKKSAAVSAEAKKAMEEAH